MPNIEVPAASADLTADGTGQGYVTVGSNDPFFVGCEAWLSSDAEPSRRCLIVDLISTNKIGLRFIEEENCGLKFQPPRYGLSDVSAYLVSDNATLSMSQQLAQVDPAFDKPGVPNTPAGLLPNFDNFSRPGADTVPSGYAIWNTDDNAINISNGVNWYDAVGNLT